MNPVVVGAVGGLAWAAGFRGLMVDIAGPASGVGWAGTFGGILLPGLVTGALLGWAAQRRRYGRRAGWLIAAPLTFVVATPSVLVTVATDGGICGGAIAVPLIGMAGGWALAGRGWTRVPAGTVAVAPVVAWVAAAQQLAPAPAVTTARGAWVAILFASSPATLAMACAVPVVQRVGGRREPQRVDASKVRVRRDEARRGARRLDTFDTPATVSEGVG
jgi:hypothetical protein